MSGKVLKTYYVVLGVHRGESAKGIRTAYKDLAKRFHPDRIGERGTKVFQEISEAYQTLSDPEKRRLYNHWLDEKERVDVDRETTLQRKQEPAAVGRETVSPTKDYRHARSPFDGFNQRFLRDFAVVGCPMQNGQRQ